MPTVPDQSAVLAFRAEIETYINNLKDPSYSVSDAERTQALGTVQSYYTYLANCGIKYGEAGSQVANNVGLFGEYANEALEFGIADAYGSFTGVQTEQMRQNISIELALRDISLRDPSGYLSYADIATYHYKTLEKNGIDRHFWGGALFEEFVGSGSYMEWFDLSVGDTASLFGTFLSETIFEIWNGTERNGVNASRAAGVLFDGDLLAQVTIPEGMEAEWTQLMRYRDIINYVRGSVLGETAPNDSGKIKLLINQAAGTIPDALAPDIIPTDPVTDPARPASSTFLTAVEPGIVALNQGGTLSDIVAVENANGNAITVEDLRRVNGLTPADDTKFKVGQKLLVPTKAGNTLSVTTMDVGIDVDLTTGYMTVNYGNDVKSYHRADDSLAAVISFDTVTGEHYIATASSDGTSVGSYAISGTAGLTPVFNPDGTVTFDSTVMSMLVNPDVGTSTYTVGGNTFTSVAGADVNITDPTGIPEISLGGMNIIDGQLMVVESAVAGGAAAVATIPDGAHVVQLAEGGFSITPLATNEVSLVGFSGTHVTTELGMTVNVIADDFGGMSVQSGTGPDLQEVNLSSTGQVYVNGVDMTGVDVSTTVLGAAYTSVDEVGGTINHTVWADKTHVIENTGPNPYDAVGINSGMLVSYGDGRSSVVTAGGQEIFLDYSIDGVVRLVDSNTFATTNIPIDSFDVNKVGTDYQSDLSQGVNASTISTNLAESVTGRNLTTDATLLDAANKIGTTPDELAVPTYGVPTESALESYTSWVAQRATAMGVTDAKGTTALYSNPAIFAVYDSALAFQSIYGAVTQPSTASILTALSATVKAAVSTGVALNADFLQSTAEQLEMTDIVGGLTAGEQLSGFISNGGATLNTLASIAIAGQEPSIRNVAGAVHSAIGLGIKLDSTFQKSAADAMGVGVEDFGNAMLYGGAALSVISAAENPSPTNVAAAGLHVANSMGAGLGVPTVQAIVSAIGFVENPSVTGGIETALWVAAAVIPGAAPVIVAVATVFSVFKSVSGKPIVLDMDGNGVKLLDASNSNAMFDLEGDGWRESRGWIDQGDALLGYDADGDGRITSYNELSFIGYNQPDARTDLEGLDAFDINNDGKLSYLDDDWAKFKVWMDDGDGISEDGEVVGLDQAGITEIILASDGVQQDLGSNTIFGEGTFTRADGTTGVFADAKLGTDATTLQIHADGALTGGGNYMAMNLLGGSVHTVGIEATSVTFDMDGDGVADRTGWVAPDHGLLFADVNLDGHVNDSSEMLGSFADLALADSNLDGKLDQSDDSWRFLKVWVDKNVDGVSQDDEIYRLAQLGVSSIALASAATERYDNGNFIRAEGSFNYTDGSSSQIAEVEMISGVTPSGNLLYAGENVSTLKLDDGRTMQLMGGGVGQTVDIGYSGIDILVDNEAGGNVLKTSGTADVLLVGGSGNGSTLIGGSGNDTLVAKGGSTTQIGGDGDDYLTSGLGADTLNGGAGVDTAFYSGVFSDYAITGNGVSATVTGLDGADTLTDVEVLQFADGRLDFRGTAATNSSLLTPAGAVASWYLTDSNRSTYVTYAIDPSEGVPDVTTGWVTLASGAKVRVTDAVTGAYEYDPGTYKGADSFQFSVTDIKGLTSAASVAVSVGQIDYQAVRSDQTGQDWSSWPSARPLVGDFNGDGVDDIAVSADGLGGLATYLSTSKAVSSNGNDSFIGGAAIDVFNGLDGNDQLIGNGGNDVLDGGEGTDTAVYQGGLSDFQVTRNGDGTVTVADLVGAEGSDTLSNIEFIQLGEETFSLAYDGSAPTVSGPVFLGTNEDTPLLITQAALLANATDVDGDAMNVVSIGLSAGAIGSLVDNLDGTWTYTPPTNWNGAVNLEYLVGDGGVPVATTATINVAAVNDAPVAISETESVVKDTVLTGAISATDVEDAPGVLSYVMETAPTNGTLVLNGDGTYAYTPTAGFTGTDTFTVRVTDSGGASDVATLSVDVTPSATPLLNEIGGETQVNVQTDRHDNTPSGTLLANGDFLVVWNSEVYQGTSVIRARRVSGGGQPIGAEFDVSADALGDDAFPKVVALGDGGYVVLLQHQDAVGQFWHLMAQRFGADDVAIGTAFEVASPNTGTYQSIALDDGGFMVGWSVGGGAFLQRYDATATGVGAPIELGDAASNDYMPVLEVLADGSIAAAWNASGELWMRRFAQDGTPDAAPAIKINDTISADSQGGRITALTDGGFMVVWNNYGMDGDAGGVYGRKFAADGTPVSGEFQLHTQTAGPQGAPRVVATDGGGFFVAWESWAGEDGSGIGVVGRMFDAGAQPLGDPFVINSFTTDTQNSPELVAGADGAILALWNSINQDGVNNASIQMQMYGEALLIEGGTGDDVLTGSGSDDTLIGNGGNDVLDAGTGNEILIGGAGADTYLSGRGEGQDTINNIGAGADGDKVVYGAGVAVDQLWFSHVGNDLQVDIIGTADGVTIKDWYATTDNHVSRLEVADGTYLLSGQVANLVSAMAAFSPPPVGQMNLAVNEQTALSPVIAASWQAP